MATVVEYLATLPDDQLSALASQGSSAGVPLTLLDAEISKRGARSRPSPLAEVARGAYRRLPTFQEFLGYPADRTDMRPDFQGLSDFLTQQANPMARGRMQLRINAPGASEDADVSRETSAQSPIPVAARGPIAPNNYDDIPVDAESAPAPAAMGAMTPNAARTAMDDYSAPMPPPMVAPRPAIASPTLIPIAQGAPPPDGAVILPADAMTPNAARTLVGDYDAAPGMDEPTTPNGARTMAADYGGLGSIPAASGAPASPVQGLIDSLLKNSEVSDQDKYMALARAGFGAAASGSPTFFGAIGAGGNAGLSAYEESRKRALQSKAQAAGLTLSEMGRVEQERSNKAREGLSGRQIDETAQSRRDALAARIEDAKARSEDRRLSITERADARRDAAQLQVQLGNIAADARRDVANRGRFSQAVPGEGVGEDGKTVKGAYVTDLNTGDVIFKPGAVVAPKGGGGGNSVFQQRVEAMKLAGFTDADIADYAAGRKKITESERIARATSTAKAKAALQSSSTKGQQVYDEIYKQVYDGLGTTAAPPAAATPAAPAARPPLSAFEKP